MCSLNRLIKCWLSCTCVLQRNVRKLFVSFRKLWIWLARKTTTGTTSVPHAACASRKDSRRRLRVLRLLKVNFYFRLFIPAIFWFYWLDTWMLLAGCFSRRWPLRADTRSVVCVWIAFSITRQLARSAKETCEKYEFKTIFPSTVSRCDVCWLEITKEYLSFFYCQLTKSTLWLFAVSCGAGSKANSCGGRNTFIVSSPRIWGSQVSSRGGHV